MAEAKEAPESLQTEESAEAEAFAQLAEKFVGENDGQEAPAEPKGEEGEETTDLSHPKDKPTDEAQDEPAAPDKPEGEDDEELPPELKDRISKRIGKEVAKRKAEQERAEALEAELEELKAKLDKPAEAKKDEPETPRDAPSQVPSLQKLEQDIEKAEKAHQWAAETLSRLRRDPDRVLAELKKKDETIQDEDDVRDLLEGIRDNAGRQWHKLTARHETERARWERAADTEREQTYASVRQVYPWVDAVKSGKDTKSAEAKIANRIRKEVPGLENAPKGWQVIARLVRAELAEQAEPAKPTATPPKPPKLPSAPKAGAPATSGKTKADVAALEKKLAESGSQEDAEALIAAKMS